MIFYFENPLSLTIHSPFSKQPDMVDIKTIHLEPYALPFAPITWKVPAVQKRASQAVAGPKLGIDSIVQIGIDSINLIKKVGPAFKDGFQGGDIFVVIQQYPTIVSIGMVAKPAFAEIKDLDPEEAKLAAGRIAKGTGLPNDNTIWGKVNLGLALGARTYEWFDEGKVLVHEWKNVFAATAFLDAQEIDAEDIRP